ncbi:MAG: HD domain-containing protein [Clostridiales bacterium]|nr:HD domain-containing protein [Clostridiales bacterium]
MSITLEHIKKNPAVRAYIKKSDESLLAMGFTEHSFAHVTRVAVTAQRILEETGHTQRDGELAAIAGYLHDIGNMINRKGHETSGALMAFYLLSEMGMPEEEIATITTTIGNHDESTAFPVNDVAAALIIADKSDVRRTRVRNKDTIAFDIHDRVNYAVTQSTITVHKELGEIHLALAIDTEASPLSEYFEIFLSRMILCRKAAEKLGYQFGLVINGQKMM